jgi:nitrogen-specific signal transduction histidine kinase
MRVKKGKERKTKEFPIPEKGEKNFSLKDIWDSFPLPVGLVTKEGYFASGNISWYALNRAPEQLLLSAEPVRMRVREALQKSRSVVLRGVTFPNQKEVYDLWISPFDDEKVWVVIADVSVYHRFQEEERYATTLESVTRMVQGILHEIRNPLAGLNALIHLLERSTGGELRSPGEDTKGYLNEMRKTIRRVDDLLMELTTLSGPLKLFLEPTNVHEILDQVIHHLSPFMEEKGVRVERYYDPSLPEIRLDSPRFFRAILNLFKNAVEAEPKGGRVEVRTRVELFGRFFSRSLVISIRDHGPGIPPSAFSYLFTPLFTTKPNGTGLGLAVSLHIIREHGGMITLQNDPGGGAVASVYLPLES